MNAIIKLDVPSAALVPANLSDAIRLAEAMSAARTVPKHLQGSPGDCLMVIEQAMRWQMSPFAVAQATSVISGKMMFEGKLVAAAVETSGAIVGHIDYEFSGQGASRAVTVSATRRGETNPREVRVTLAEAKTSNSMWQSQPDQQLCYHGARVWARRWTPAVILGVYSREEMGRVIDVTPEPEATIEGDAVTAPAAAANQPGASTQRAEAPSGSDAPAGERPAQQVKKRTWSDWLDDAEIRFAAVHTEDDLRVLLASHEVITALQKLTNSALHRLQDMIQAATERAQVHAEDEAEAAIDDEMVLPE